MSFALNGNGCTVSGGGPQMDTMPIQVAAGSLEISTVTQRVSANGIHILLRRAEFRLLFFFMSHPERVHSRGQLLNQVWNRKALVGVRTVDVHVRRLRAALEPFGLDCLIQTVHGSGYRFSTAHGGSGERCAGAMRIEKAVLKNTAVRALPSVLN